MVCKVDGKFAVWKKSHPMDVDSAIEEQRDLFCVSHPNCVRLQDAYANMGNMTSVYDYIEGEQSLQEELDARNEAGKQMTEQ